MKMVREVLETYVDFDGMTFEQVREYMENAVIEACKRSAATPENFRFYGQWDWDEYVVQVVYDRPETEREKKERELKEEKVRAQKEKRQAAAKLGRERAKAKKEAAEREEYERLKAKFEGGM
jgi:hypothetical protein